MTENHERTCSSFNLTLLEEVKASANFCRKLRSSLPNREMDIAIQLHLEGIATLLDDVIVKLESLQPGKIYDTAGPPVIPSISLNDREMAFHSADKHKISKAALAAAQTMGLNQGSVNSFTDPYKSYDLYKLLEVYVNDPEKRLEIHRVIGIKTDAANNP